jgi:uncharacterized membrane protein YqaE (UPF0057 family)
MVFDTIFKAVKNMALALGKLGEFIGIIMKLIFELVPIVTNIFNPVYLINDIITGIVMGIKIVLNGIIGGLNPSNFFGGNKKTKYNRNKDIGSGLFGMRRNYDRESNKLENNKNNKICARSTLFRMILMVLCPPLALLQHLGLRGWFNVVICGILTIYGYYFPGLMYSMMHILC